MRAAVRRACGAATLPDRTHGSPGGILRGDRAGEHLGRKDVAVKQPTAIRVQTICLASLTVLAIGAALKWLAPVMIPFVLAFFFSQILSPLVRLLVERMRLPRIAAVAVTLTLAFMVFVGTASLITTSVGQLGANAEGYQQKAVELINSTTEWLPFERFGIEDTMVTEPLKAHSLGALGSLLLGTTNAILDLLSNGLLVLIFLVFLLLGPSSRPVPPGSFWEKVDGPIRRYLFAKGILSAATGLLVALVLGVLNVDLALLFGLFAFLLNFIPNIGPVIATLLPIPVVVASPNLSVTAAVLAIVVPGTIQFTIGNLIEPKLVGDSLDLSPVAILLNLIIWGMLWGIVGMLLSTPILVMLKILCEQFEDTRPLARLVSAAAEPA
jgi:AI-2 transport protein TqsA